MSPLPPYDFILPGGALSAWGGRRPQTAVECEYARAVAQHAKRRQQLVDAARVDGDARKAWIATAAEHGPCHAQTDTARQRWAAAHADTARAAQALDAATERLTRAADAWAVEVAAQQYARATAPVEDVGDAA